MQGFRKFILRGNVIDLAVGIIIGAAFTAIINSLVKDLITPFIGIFGGIPDFSAWTFTINGSQFNIGSFINAVLTFLIMAAVLYWVIIIPMNRLTDLMKTEEPPTPKTKECPECLSKIPDAAKRCPFCTTVLVPDEPTIAELAGHVPAGQLPSSQVPGDAAPVPAATMPQPGVTAR